MAEWADRAVEEIEGQLERNEIDYDEYNHEMRSIREELQEEAEGNATQAYNDTFDGH